MKFLVDAQLPPALAHWLREAGHEAQAVGEVGSREMAEQLVSRLKECKEELFNLRFQLATGQLDNSARIGQVKKDVARMLTELRNREIAEAEGLALADLPAHDDLRAVVINCSLKPSPERSHTDGLLDLPIRIWEERGVQVTVLEMDEVPLARVLGPQLGASFADLHRAHGLD